MKQILLLSVLLSGVFNVYSYAQLTDPVYSVPTADVATLGEFGQVPVSHFTGVPDVSVPLYTIDCGDICWPIGFAYHLGSVRVVADAAGNVLQRNDYLPYGEDYVATYAPGGDILAGLNIPLIIEEDDDEEEENLEGGNRSGEIEEGDEEDPGDEVVGVIGPEYYRSFNAYRFSGKEQVRGLYDFGARWFTPKRAHWTTMDPLAEKYYSISPYVYCAGNPVNIVDPSGKKIYMLFYTVGNDRGDQSFKSAAMTRKNDIENSAFFNPEKDIVIMRPIKDLAKLSFFVNVNVIKYSGKYGKTAEFSIWSHSGFDGPVGSTITSKNALDNTQMDMNGWGNINFNWDSNSTANFFGCRSGMTDLEHNESFTNKISSLDNFSSVSVNGQIDYSYPSYFSDSWIYSKMIGCILDYAGIRKSTYFVGGEKNSIKHFFFGSSAAKPMMRSVNGKEIGLYFQSGIKTNDVL
ncbi:MAG: RHS repeat-associated core domain-containing protein [Bacteroidales bacterium]|nr:RHS repeat-associated core domain-containing protein [Bacteroidales bacterium]